MSVYNTSRGPDSPYTSNRPGVYTGERPGNRTSGQSGNEPLRSGLYVYVKAGTRLYFYVDTEGKTRLGGTKGQDNSPYKVAGEFVGRTTGLSSNDVQGKLLVQVDWEHSYWDGGFLGIGGKRRIDKLTSYVYADQVELRTAQGDVDIVDNRPPTTTPPPGGDNNDTLLYAGIGLAAATLLSPKKRKKR